VVATIENANAGVPAQITLPEQTPRVGGEGAVYFAEAYAVNIDSAWRQISRHFFLRSIRAGLLHDRQGVDDVALRLRHLLAERIADQAR